MSLPNEILLPICESLSKTDLKSVRQGRSFRNIFTFLPRSILRIYHQSDAPYEVQLVEWMFLRMLISS